MRARSWGFVAAAGAAAVLVSGASVSRASEAPEPPAPAEEPSAAPSSPPVPAVEEAGRDQTQAAAAMRAVQDLEARMLEMRRELEALERQRASWEDVRTHLDAVDARLRDLSRDAAAAPPGEQPATIQFRDGGFSIRSPDGSFVLWPGFRLQAGWAGQLARSGAFDTAPPDSSSFLLTHAEIMLDGHAICPRLEYRLQIDFAATPMVKDAYLQFRILPTEALRLGQFKVPYAMQRLIYSGELEFVDVSAATAAFSLERDVGIMLDGRPLAGRLHYQLAVLNGTAPGSPGNLSRVNDNLDLAYAVRIVAAPFGPLPSSEGDIAGHPMPLVAVAFAGYYSLVPTDVVARTGDASAPTDVDGNGRTDNVAVWQGAVELRAVFRGAALQAEWFGRRESPGAAAPDRTFWGAYAQASYFVLPHRIEVAARASRTDLPLYGATLLDHLRAGTSVNEESAVIDAFLRGHHAKLQLEYTHQHSPDAGSAPTADKLQAFAQLWY